MTGVGMKAFCAGGDIINVYKSSTGERPHTIKRDQLYHVYRLCFILAKLSQDVIPGCFQISLWNGIVMGGGVGLSIFAPIRIATE